MGGLFFFMASKKPELCMADNRRFYCPGCDDYVGGDYGPISGSWLCEVCKTKGADKKSRRKKDS